MSSSNKHNLPHFLDKSTLIALVLVFVAWFFWGQHMKKKYPSLKEPPIPIKEQENSEPPSRQIRKQKIIIKQKDHPLKELFFENKEWELVFVSKGMGIKKVKLKNFSDRKDKRVEFKSINQDFLFEIKIQDQSIYFDIQKQNQNTLVGKAYLENYEIESKIEINEYYLNHILTFKRDFPSDITIQTVNVPKKGASGLIQSFISGAEPGLSLFSLGFDEQENRILYIPEEKAFLDVKGLQVLGFGTRYFGQAFSNGADIFPSLNFQGEDSLWKAKIKYTFPKIGSISSIKYKTFFGPKSIETLETVDQNLALWVDYGFFHYVSKFILIFLKFAHSLTGNWGLAIVLLTLLVRFVLFPLNLAAYRSMKTMKKIQPEIKKIREKYKKDAKKMNEEILVLMKQNKAKPFGSILPLVLQFPIFFALYRVLAESFELYQSPFFLWIKDLSTKDPFFILPILMGGAMYLQQKVTPMNVEPAQEKILKILPVIFTFFMLNLPSGLTLYILISTVFGLVQQYFFVRAEKNENTILTKKQGKKLTLQQSK